MNIVNIGSVNIDFVYQMDHFVQPGETISCTSRAIHCGGKGLNQSIALAMAGSSVWHACIIGQDGRFLAEKMQEKGVNTSLIRQGDFANGHAIIQVDKNGQNCIILDAGSNHQLTEAYIDSVLSHFSAGDIVVLQNEVNNIPYIMKRSHELGLRIAFNAAPYSDAIREYPLELVDWLIVNEVEGGGLSGKEGYEEIAEELIRLYPKCAVMLTMGKSGCIYCEKGRMIRQNACVVSAVDSTAAGDTFIGYFMRGISDGLPMEQTLRLATVASAISVTRPGAADSIPSYEEVLKSPLLQQV